MSTTTLRPHRDDMLYREAEAAVWARFGRPDPVEHLIPVPGWGIEARALAHGEGRTVVMVHGMLCAGPTMVPLGGALDEERIVVLDRPGCGLADAVDMRRFTAPDYMALTVAVLSSVVEALGSGPVDLVGHSLGGGQALTFAAARPDLVRSVVVDGVPGVQGITAIRDLRVLSAGPIGRWMLRQWPELDDARRMLITMGHEEAVREGAFDGPQLEWDVSLGRYTESRLNDVALLQRMLRPWKTRADWLPGPRTIAAVQAPTLWITGTRDPFAPAERVRGWAGGAREATVEVLEGVGHLPFYDDPARDAALIRRWWSDLH